MLEVSLSKNGSRGCLCDMLASTLHDAMSASSHEKLCEHVGAPTTKIMVPFALRIMFSTTAEIVINGNLET